MNTRFRLLVITLGALLVALTFTFPTWIVYFQNNEEVVPFPELEPELIAAFELLPQEQQTAYLALRGQNPTLAAQMLIPALQAPAVVPNEEQVKPEFEGEQEVSSGEFVEITPIRSAQGTATLYQLPDGTRYLWLSDFTAINGPGLRLFLTRTTPVDLEEYEFTFEEEEELALKRDDLLLDPLRFNVGSQSFDVPSEINLEDYNSVMIFSTDLNIIYSLAPLN